MKTLKNLIALVLISLMLLACGSGKIITPLKSVREKDSISTTTKYIKRDTTIFIAGDTSKITVPVYKITEQPIYSYSDRTTLSLRRVGGEIEAECKLDSFSIQLMLKDKEIELHRFYFKELKETNVKLVKYVPKVIKILAWIGGGLVAALIGLFAIKRFKLL